MSNYSVENNKIIVHNLDDFDIEHILECGQVFRYVKLPTGYKVFTKNLTCILIYDKDSVIINSSDSEYFIRYFDLDRDYSLIKKELLRFPNMSNSITHGAGIRILNQDACETIFSFIISANNNIPRIRLTIERMCMRLGKNMGDWYAFPEVDDLVEAGVQFFREIGAGYRSEYLSGAARLLKDGFFLDISDMSTKDAHRHLLKLPGVGPKVADCILLFAYHRTDSFPTDVWIERVYHDMFPDKKATVTAMSDYLCETYGNLSGYAQQYLFYQKRMQTLNRH
ncbi:MAG: 8-oxoguanine DNA glycosylase [Christensenellaceae bacterium]|nr:8-oxoguanine DNA glycosylase [Christensenellaceae bacterium]